MVLLTVVSNWAMAKSIPAKLPPDAMEYLRSFDFWGKTTSVDTFTQVLVGTFEKIDDASWVANVLTPHLPNSDYFGGAQSPWKTVAQTEYQMIIRGTGDYSHELVEALGESSMIYIHHGYLACDDPLTIEIVKGTVLINWAREVPDAAQMLEMFSGGFGGWSFAMKSLMKCDFPPKRIFGVEWDKTMALMYAMNHQASICPAKAELKPGWLQNEKGNVVFQMRVQDPQWLQQCINNVPAYATMSAPCPPWSTGGLQGGFSDENGLALLYAWGALRQLQPTWVAFEQVAGFKAHPQYQDAQLIANWAGYELVHEVTIDLAETAPVKRPRLLGIYARFDAAAAPRERWQRWIKWIEQTPRTFGSYEHLSEEEVKQFEPTYDEASMYMEPTLMPGPLRPWSRSEILAQRIPGLDQKQGTFMHAYGRQHSLPSHHLHSKGLFGFFIRQGNTFRFWTPWEQAMLHLQDGDLCMLKPKEVSWGALGNFIAIPHAMLLLGNMIAWHEPNEVKMSMSAAFQKLMINRFTAANTIRLQDEYAWYLVQKGKETGVQRLLQAYVAQLDKANGSPRSDLSLPDGMWWHPVKGIQEEASNPEELPNMMMPKIQTSQLTLNIQAVPGNYGEYFVQAEEPASAIWDVWRGQLIPSTCQSDTWTIDILDKDQEVLMPRGQFDIDQIKIPSVDAYRKTLLLRTPRAIVIMNIPVNEPLEKLRMQWPGLQGDLHDQYGLLKDSAIIEDLEVLTTESPPSILPIPLNFMIQELYDVKIEATYVIHTDILSVSFRGPPEALQLVRHLWTQAFSTPWQMQHSREIHWQTIENDHAQLLFRPPLQPWQGSLGTTPAIALTKLIPRRLLCTMLPLLQAKTTNTCPFQLKHNGREVGLIIADLDEPFASTLTLLRHAFYIEHFGQTPAIIIHGKRCSDHMTLQKIYAKQVTATTDGLERKVLTGHIEPPLAGGGPDYGTKNAFRQMIQSKLATMLLEEGLGVTQVPDVVGKLVEQVGYPRLHHLLHLEHGMDRSASLRRLCEDCQVELPQPSKQTAKVDWRILKQAKKNHEATEDFEVNDYVLQDGFFKYEDTKDAMILATFQPKLQGVCLLNARQAEQWIASPQPVSPDELAILVAGLTAPQTTLPYAEVTAPAFDQQGRSVLLKGALIQLGEKKIVWPDSQDITMESPKVIVSAITVYKDEQSEDTWRAITQNPVKTVKSLLTLQGFAGMIGRPWARTYRDGETVVPASMATSIQFHAEIQAERFDSLLARSGFIGIYVLPKDGNGKPSEQYRMLWTQMPIRTLDTLTAGLHGIAGYVRTKKGYGLRVLRAAFESIWKVVNPSLEMPQENNMLMQYKVQPFPNGTTKDMIKEWGTKQNWEVNPLRTSGAKQWILGADHAPPPILLWNGSPLIAHKIEKRQSQDRIIVAGPTVKQRLRHPRNKFDVVEQASIAGSEKSTAPSTASTFRTGDPWFDPWAAARSSATASTSAGPSQVKPQSPPQGLTGPTANQLSLQEQRLQALEHVVQGIQSEQKQMQASNEEKFTAIEQQMQDNQAETKKGIDRLVADNQVVRQALHRQDEQLASSLQEIKSLFTQHGSKRSRPSPFHEGMVPGDHEMETTELM